jgi:hypothetical protein
MEMNEMQFTGLNEQSFLDLNIARMNMNEYLLSNDSPYIRLALAFLLLVVMIKAGCYLMSADYYYKRYPAAKLMDDAAKQGIDLDGEAILERMGRTDLSRSAIKKETQLIRDEFGIKELKK